MLSPPANGLRRLINAVQLRVNTGEADGEVKPLLSEMPEDSKLLIGGKQKQRSRVALGHTVASVSNASIVLCGQH